MWTPERFRALRKRYQETQAQFAERLGITVHSVAGYEQGRTVPSGSVRKLLDLYEERMPEPLTASEDS